MLLSSFLTVFHVISRHEFSNYHPQVRRRQWHPTPVLLTGKSHGRRSLVGSAVHGVARSRIRLSDFTFTFHFHALEKEMATHSSVLAWRIPGMAEPGGLPSMGSHRVGHYWSDLAAAATSTSSISSDDSLGLKYSLLGFHENFFTLCPLPQIRKSSVLKLVKPKSYFPPPSSKKLFCYIFRAMCKASLYSC